VALWKEKMNREMGRPGEGDLVSKMEGCVNEGTWERGVKK